MKKLAILKLAILLVIARTAVCAQEIIEKSDPALGVRIFALKKVPGVGVNQGLMKLDHITWRVSPLIYQKLDGTAKQAAMKIELAGPMNGGFTNAPLIVNIDGDIKTVPISEWTNLNTLFGNDVSAIISLRDESFREIAGAKELYLTIVLEGTPERYTVRLTADKLAAFGAMLSKYDELEPKRTATN